MHLAKTILKNAFSNWVGMFTAVVVTILLTPYLLRHLGDERYGIYQIVVPIVGYLVLLEMGLRGSVARFASKYVYADDHGSLNSVICTTLFFGLCLGVLVMAISLAFGFLMPKFILISEIYRVQTLYLFVGLGFGTVLSFLSYGFGGVLIGHNRYDLLNAGLIINSAWKAVLIITFFSCGWVSLSSWALAITLSGLLGLIFVVTMAYYIHRDLSVKIKCFRLSTFGEMAGFGLWNLLLQLAYFLGLSANPIIIGRYLGADMVPYYAIPFMLTNGLRSLVVGLTTTLVPVASSTLTSRDVGLMQNLLKKGTYVSAMLVFPLGGVLIVMCKSLFAIWLPEGYENSWVIYAILMIAFFGSITQTTSYYILLGGGDIRGMALAYASAGVAAVALGVYFVHYLGLGIVGAAIALVIPRFVSTCLFQPWYASKQVRLGFLDYLWNSYSRPALCVLPSIGIAVLLVHFLPPENLLYWILEYFVALVPFAVFALTGVLDWPLRRQIVDKLKSLISTDKVFMQRRT